MGLAKLFNCKRIWNAKDKTAVSYIIYIPSIFSIFVLIFIYYSFKEIQSKKVKILNIAHHQIKHMHTHNHLKLFVWLVTR